MDFFTWHGYLGKNGIGKIALEYNFIKETLLKYGFDKTEIIDAEWNVSINDIETEDFRTQYYINMRNEKGASHVAAALFEMQRLGVDAAMYYDAQLWCSYGALFHVPELEPTKAYFAFSLFGEMYGQKNAVYTSCDTTGVYALAVSGEKNILAISNINDCYVHIQTEILSAGANKAKIYICDSEHDLAYISEKDFSVNSELILEPYSFIKLVFE